MSHPPRWPDEEPHEDPYDDAPTDPYGQPALRGSDPFPDEPAAPPERRRGKATRIVVVSVIAVIALALSGVGLHFLLTGGQAPGDDGHGEPTGGGTPATADPAPDTSTAAGVATAVVSGLNKNDLDALLALTCDSGRAEGRKALLDALPQLGPSASPRTPAVSFELGGIDEDRPGEATVPLTARYRDDQGVDHSRNGRLLLLKDGDRWTLCGLTMGASIAPVPSNPATSSRRGTPTRKSTATTTVPTRTAPR